MFNNLLANQGGYPNPTVVAKFANPTTDFTTLSTTTAMPSGGSISRSGQGMLYDSTGKLTYAPNNLLLRSQEFNTTWVSPIGGNTVTADTTVSPDGGTNADTVNHTNTADAPLRQSVTVTNDSNKYIASVYVKQGTCPYVSIGIYFSGGTTTQYPIATLRWSDLSVGSRYGNAANVTSVGNGWYRLSLVHSNNSTGSTTAVIDVRVMGDSLVAGYGSTTDNGTAFIWGAQLEAVTYQTTPSTYVATTTAAYYGPRFDYNPSTLAAKGLLIEGTRTNLLFRSQEFDNAAWTKTRSSITANSVASPDGTITADTLVEDTTASNSHVSGQSISFSALPYTYTCFVKSAGRNFVAITAYDGTINIGRYFNLSSGTLGSAFFNAPTSSSITSVGNGWYRCSITFTPAAASGSVNVYLASADATFNYTGDGTSGIYVWGAQLEATAFASSYIPTVASTVARAAETFAITGYSSSLINAYYTDEATGGSYSLPYNAGTAPSPSFSWLTSLRTYTNAYAGSISSPSWLSFSRSGNAMMTDSTGELTYAPANILTYSEQFDNAAWAKTNLSVTANTTTAPDGTTTADKVLLANSNSVHQLSQTDTATAGTLRVWSIYAKADTHSFIQLMFGADVTAFANFNISTGALGTVGAAATATITSIGSGWYRCSIFTSSASANGILYVLGVSSTTAIRNESWAAAGTEAFLVWGAQLERVTYETSPSAYIPTTTAAVYGPRYDFDPSTIPATPRGLLIEESRSNLFTYSEQFDNAAWSKLNTTITANNTVAPDGTSNADKLIATTTNGQHYIQQTITVTGNTSYTLSAYFKAAEYGYCGISTYDGTAGRENYFNILNGTVTASTLATGSVVNVGNGWYRCITTITTASSATSLQVYMRVANVSGSSGYSYAGDGTSGVFLWGAQLEAGSFATSYIPTTTASVTRAADVAQLTGSALTTLTSSTFSALVQGLAYTAFSPARIVLGANGVSLLGFSVNSTTSFATFDPSSSPTGAVATLGSGSSTTTGYRLAISANATSRNIVGNNGTVVTTSPFSTAITAIQLGNYNNFSTFTTNGWVSSLALYNTRLPDAVLKTKSAVGAPY